MASPLGPAKPQLLIAHNWETNPQVDSAWETSITRDVNGSEQRRMLRGKPERVQRVAGLTFQSHDVARLRLQIKEATRTKQYIPLYADVTPLVVDAPTSSTTINCNPANKRFAVGDLVMLVDWEDGRVAHSDNIHVARITQVNSTNIVIDAGTNKAYPSNTTDIYPVTVCHPRRDISFSPETDSVIALQGRYEEIVGTDALTPAATANEVPSGISSYRGLPVLDMEHNWSGTTQEGALIEGKASAVGLSKVEEHYGDPKYTGILQFRQLDRPSAWKLMQFFDSRAGAAWPFWYPHRTADMHLLNVSSTVSITINGSDLNTSSFNDKFIAVWYQDGTCVIRLVTNVIASSSTDPEISQSFILSLNEALPSSSGVVKVSFASLARFATDALTEQWVADDKLDAQLAIRGLCIGDTSETGNALECGNCEDESCPVPDDPSGPEDPGPPFEPRKSCTSAIAQMPMYYDMTNISPACEGREPIRAADLHLPFELLIEVTDRFVFDPQHPAWGQDISPELAEALFTTHALEYIGTTSRSANKSRNPYHYRQDDPGLRHRAGGELVQDSPTWQATVDYKINEDTPEEEDHTLTLTFYAEWVDQTADGPVDTDYGAWGSMFVFWAHSTETDTYTDGEVATGFDNHIFYESDPLVGKRYVGSGVRSKYAHPNALFIAMCPSTWHFHVGFEHYEAHTRDSRKVECFDIPSGYFDRTSGALQNLLGNNVFGAPYAAAIGALGGWTKSEFFNFACIENGRGDGLTILKPTNAGWDEDTGEMDTQTDIRFDICTVPNEGIDPCDGHPDDPYRGFGGTHDVYRDQTAQGELDRLCFKLNSNATLTISDECVKTRRDYDADCEFVSGDCQGRILQSVATMSVHRYSYGVNPTVTTGLRILRFHSSEDNKTVVRSHFPDSEGCDPESDCWNAEVGGITWLTEDSATITTGGSLAVSSLIEYDHSDGNPNVIDGSISYNVTANGSQRVGAVCRGSDTFGSLSTGYLAIVDEVEDALILYKVTAPDTITEIDREDLQEISGEYNVTLRAYGNSITASTTAGGGGSLSLTDCDFVDSGRMSITSLHSGAFTVSDVVVRDENFYDVEVTCRVQGKPHGPGSNGNIITFDGSNDWTKLADRVDSGQCGYTTPEGCPGAAGPGPDCNGPCTTTTYSAQGEGHFDSDEYSLGRCQPANRPDWYPPTQNGSCDQFPEDCVCDIGGSSNFTEAITVRLSFTGNDGFAETEDWYNNPQYSPFIGGGMMHRYPFVVAP